MLKSRAKATENEKKEEVQVMGKKPSLKNIVDKHRTSIVSNMSLISKLSYSTASADLSPASPHKNKRTLKSFNKERRKSDENASPTSSRLRRSSQNQFGSDEEDAMTSKRSDVSSAVLQLDPDGNERNSVTRNSSVTAQSMNSIVPSNVSIVSGLHSQRYESMTSRPSGGQVIVWGCIRKSTMEKIERFCREVSKLKMFQLVMFVALIFALFLPDVWIMTDRENNNDLDILLTVVFAAFLVEVTVQAIGFKRTYFNTFFFYMDIVGALSLLLDLTYLGIGTMLSGRSSDGEMQTGNGILIRVARIAKLGARAGRFTRLIKLLRYLPGMSDSSEQKGTAKAISAKLINALATRVSCLIILMVVIMPLFSLWTYPEIDRSMEGWLQILDRAVTEHPDRVEHYLNQFANFFQPPAEDNLLPTSGISYFPYSLDLKESSKDQLSSEVLTFFPWTKAGGAPARDTNSNLYLGTHLRCRFNFTKPNQVDSLMNVILMIVIMILMTGFSLVLSNSITGIVFDPLQKLLQNVGDMAKNIFQSVSDMAMTMATDEGDDADSNDEDDADNANAFVRETDLLEKVVRKLEVLTKISNSKSAVNAEMIDRLGEEDKAIIQGWSQGRVEDHVSEFLADCKAEEDEEEDIQEMNGMLEKAGFHQGEINSWNLSTLELDKARNHAAVMYFVGVQNHGIAFDPETMTTFLETAENGYLKTCNFHNWFHAVDTTHCVYRFLQLCHCKEFLSGFERYALIITAICHDIDHPGLNNAFLIETSHELAMRYNDRSPLENMHASRLFDILQDEKKNIFETLSRSQFQEVRRQCVDGILHTDNGCHFTIVKEVQMIYEVNSEVLDVTYEQFPNQDAIDCYRQPESRRILLNLLLHLADLSNSLKPFRICNHWAWLLLDECFTQGDLEKQLDVPVQALNDRDKVNVSFSQIGFIDFLVSPLVFATLKILPPLEDRAEQMLSNAKSWHQKWITDFGDSTTDQEQRNMQDRLLKLEARFEDAIAK
jgi:hypothetical protein